MSRFVGPVALPLRTILTAIFALAIVCRTASAAEEPEGTGDTSSTEIFMAPSDPNRTDRS